MKVGQALVHSTHREDGDTHAEMQTTTSEAKRSDDARALRERLLEASTFAAAPPPPINYAVLSQYLKGALFTCVDDAAGSPYTFKEPVSGTTRVRVQTRTGVTKEVEVSSLEPHHPEGCLTGIKRYVGSTTLASQRNAVNEATGDVRTDKSRIYFQMLIEAHFDARLDPALTEAVVRYRNTPEGQQRIKSDADATRLANILKSIAYQESTLGLAKADDVGRQTVNYAEAHVQWMLLNHPREAACLGLTPRLLQKDAALNIARDAAQTLTSADLAELARLRKSAHWTSLREPPGLVSNPRWTALSAEQRLALLATVWEAPTEGFGSSERVLLGTPENFAPDTRGDAVRARYGVLISNLAQDPDSAGYRTSNLDYQMELTLAWLSHKYDLSSKGSSDRWREAVARYNGGADPQSDYARAVMERVDTQKTEIQANRLL